MKRFAVVGLLIVAACTPDPPPAAVMVPAATPPPSAAEPPPPAPLASASAEPEPAPSNEPPPSTSGHLTSKFVNGPTLCQGAITVTGKLPPEVIQRIVRQHFGRFRLCYERGLGTTPTLSGRVTVKFTIDKSGSVKGPADGGSDLPDKSVVSCVVKGFADMSFPQPESGSVAVIFPILFSP